jgi:hypothetical protein
VWACQAGFCSLCLVGLHTCSSDLMRSCAPSDSSVKCGPSKSISKVSSASNACLRVTFTRPAAVHLKSPLLHQQLVSMFIGACAIMQLVARWSTCLHN